VAGSEPATDSSLTFSGFFFNVVTICVFGSIKEKHQQIKEERMKLGMLINTDSNTEHIVGLTKAALAKGHEVVVFMMDVGVRNAGDKELQALCSREGVQCSLCDHSAHNAHFSTEGLPETIAVGSQYNNAVMNADVDKVIVL
jgi:hypothetical protein